MAFVIMHQFADHEDPRPCEVENGVCYEHFPTLEEAQAYCDESNTFAISMGWPSRYEPAPAPAGLILADLEH